MAAAHALAIVGAGPCGLAVLLRLVRAARGYDLPRRAVAEALLTRLVVIDASGGWLALWRRKLGSQGVEHLRSPTFVHPHASRVIDDALLAFGAARRRSAEMLPLAEAGAARCWHVPSAGLFEDFCADALAEVAGYDSALADRLLAARVIDVRPLPAGEGRGFELALEGGGCVRAERVVLALGDGCAPRAPAWSAAARRAAPPGRLLHAADLAALHPATPLLPVAPDLEPGEPTLGARARAALGAGWEALRAALGGGALGATSAASLPVGRGRLVVVGGGLSGAQLACRAVRLGWRRVSLVVRAEVRVRLFDLEAAWIGRHWEAELQPCEAEFFGASAADRRELLRRARPGGSLTPAMHARLSAMRGAVEVLERTDVHGATWQAAGGRGGRGERGGGGGGGAGGAGGGGEGGGEEGGGADRGDGGGGEWRLALRREDAGGGGGVAETSLRADAVWLATGHDLDVASLPLGTLRRLRPRPEHGGLPELTPALRWADRSELYVAGALAALQVGPDALNLGGAGVCAARIASDLLWLDPGA